MSTIKRVTLKDIANKTGYTINTVSHALKDMGDISEATKAKIRQAAKELNYVEDMAARALRSGKTQTIAVIVGDISNPFFSNLVRGIEYVAKEHGYSLTIFSSSENSEWEKSAIMAAYSQRVDGIFICPVQENLDNLELLNKIGIPFVLMGRYFKDQKTNAVVWDDRKGGEIATRHLIDVGHMNILYIGGSEQTSSGKERLQGYRDAHDKAGISIKESLIHMTDITVGNNCSSIKKILAATSPFTAIVVFSDLIAYEVMNIVYREQNRIIDSNTLVGFDCIQRKLMLPFGFLSVDCVEDEPKTCMELMLRLIRKEQQTENEFIVLDVELINPHQ